MSKPKDNTSSTQYDSHEDVEQLRAFYEKTSNTDVKYDGALYQLCRIIETNFQQTAIKEEQGTINNTGFTMSR
jgi:hypothetical protein